MKNKLFKWSLEIFHTEKTFIFEVPSSKGTEIGVRRPILEHSLLTIGYENKNEIKNLKNEAIHKCQELLLLNAEFGISYYRILFNYYPVRENVRLKIVESHAHIILAPYTETILQLSSN